MNTEDDIFEYPKWMECQWRRERCNKIECPLCYRLLKQEQKHRLRGEDPNDMKTVTDDVTDSLGEAMMMLDQIAKEDGIDLDNMPEPEMPGEDEIRNMPVYKSVNNWMMNVHKFLRDLLPDEALWLKTESGKDIAWYHTMISAKVYRQLNNCWHIEHNDTDNCDYVYTKGVIGEIIKILKKSFQAVLSYDLTYSEKSALQDLFDEFLNFETGLLSI